MNRDLNMIDEYKYVIESFAFHLILNKFYSIKCVGGHLLIEFDFEQLKINDLKENPMLSFKRIFC